jgi:dolichol kinase
MQPDETGRVLAGVATVVIAYGALFGGAEILRRWGVAGGTTRTIVHVCASLLALGLPSLFDSPWPVVLMAIAFSCVMLISDAVGLLGSIHDVPRRTVGAPAFPLGIAAAFVLTGAQAPDYPVAVLALGLADPAAALAGHRFARRSIGIWGTRRTLEGSVAGCLTASVTTAIVLIVAGGAEPTPLLAASMAVGLAVALAEAASPGGLDNIAIPTAAVAALDAAGSPWWIGVVLVGLASIVVVGAAWRRPIVADAVRDDPPR